VILGALAEHMTAIGVTGPCPVNQRICKERRGPYRVSIGAQFVRPDAKQS
jgi:hypothetical protein